MLKFKAFKASNQLRLVVKIFNKNKIVLRTQMMNGFD